LERHAVEVAEKYAEGCISREDRDATYLALHQDQLAFEKSKAPRTAAWRRRFQCSSPERLVQLTLEDRTDGPWCVVSQASDLPSVDIKYRLTWGRWKSRAARARAEADFLSRRSTERKWQTATLRHIFGNPFRPYPAPVTWPSTVVQLAESLYNGQDCAFALHDALLEAGHAELAEHFREEKSHPKGCWVVDLVLGKS
jgi:hypothetical protein